MIHDLPLHEFDPDARAVIEPSEYIQSIDIPEHCVLPMWWEVIDSLKAQNRLTLISKRRSSMGPMPVYVVEHNGAKVAVAHPGLGAPLTAALLEEIIALGARKFVACGAAGVLDRTLAKGSVVVPDKAVRDEGTSFHYVAPSREIALDADAVRSIERILETHHVPYRTGKTWTTDGVYRETRGRVAKRKAEGCLTVEMECSALAAVCQFRNVRFGQILAASDDVSGDEWDPRFVGEDATPIEKIFWLSVEACLAL